MKTPPVFTQAQMEDLEESLRHEKESWARHRIETIITVAKEAHNLSAKEIASRHGIGYSTLFRWIKRFKQNGVGALLCRLYRRSPAGRDEAMDLFHMRILNTGRIEGKYELKEWRDKGGDTRQLGIFAHLG